jgi:hypothetical protein
MVMQAGKTRDVTTIYNWGLVLFSHTENVMNAQVAQSVEDVVRYPSAELSLLPCRPLHP